MQQEKNLIISKNKLMSKETFLQIHQQCMESLGFWSEEYRSPIITQIERRYKPEILQEWFISDIVANADKFLIKWAKRPFKLSLNKIKETYGF